MIQRTQHLREVLRRLRQFPVVAVVGARQIGKTTLANQVAKEYGKPFVRFDLQAEPDRARLTDPYLALEDLRGLVVLDEIQLRPELFPALRVLADRRPRRCRFLILGSSSPDLLQQSSETLAGRISYYTLPGLSLMEVGPERLKRLWLRGGFPLSYTARSQQDSFQWRESFVRTFLTRDLLELGINISPNTMRRFWTMLAHWHGQTWNASEFSRSFGVSDVTVRRYLDLLTSALVVRQVQPWFANVRKRQVKAPKVYIRDSGLLHRLLALETSADLESHPKLGASWEGFLLDQVATRLGLDDDQLHFWGVHTGAEIDLFVQRGRRKIGFEFKRTSSPKVTSAMHSALETLELTDLLVVHAGKETFPLAPKIRALAARDLVAEWSTRGK